MKRVPLLLGSLVLLAAPACTGNLPVPQIVTTPRILAIVADEPESHPGDDIHVHALMHDTTPRPLVFEWRACLSIEALLGGSSIPSGLPEETCFPIPSEGENATVPGIATQMVVDQLEMLGNVGGFDVAFLIAVLNTAGFSFRVEVDVRTEAGELLVSAFKRVAITGREELTTNPPPIDYLFGETYVSMPASPIGTDAFPGFECVVWGAPITIEANTEVVIAPQGDPADWIETFQVFDYSGGITEGTENAYYSFYATAGGLTDETTRLPVRNATYASPPIPGPVRFYLAVRDGHLGTRACGFDATIVPATP